MGWFKKNEPKHDGGMSALRAAVQKKKEVAERILNRPALIEYEEEIEDRRKEDLPIYFDDRRSHERRQLPA